MNGEGSKNGSERPEDMFKTHSNLNASPHWSHYLRALVMKGVSHKTHRGVSFEGDGDHREPAGHRGEEETDGWKESRVW